MKHFLKGVLEGKNISAKIEKICWQINIAAWCSHSNTIYDVRAKENSITRCQATLTQPLQCVLRHHVANLHVSTHVATSDDDNHAAIPMRSATTIQETNRATHTGTTTRCRTQRRNQNDSSRTRRTQEVPFIAACSHFTRKNARFRAPTSSPFPFATTSLPHHFPSSPFP